MALFHLGEDTGIMYAGKLDDCDTLNSTAT